MQDSNITFQCLLNNPFDFIEKGWTEFFYTSLVKKLVQWHVMAFDKLF